LKGHDPTAEISRFAKFHAMTRRVIPMFELEPAKKEHAS
jgi:hypothetical protein